MEAIVEDHADLELPPVDTVDINVEGGTVAVLAGPGPGRLVIDQVEGSPVEVVCEDGRLVIRHRRDRVAIEPAPGGRGSRIRLTVGWTRRQRADVTVALPDPGQVTVRGVSASIVVSGISRARLVSVSGDLTLRDAEGVQADTVSGHIRGAGLRGPVSLSTVSGELEIAGASSPEFRARTVSGRVSVDLDVGPGEHGVASTSGDVALRIGGGCQIEARSMSGAVRCPNAEPRGRSGPPRVRAQLGDGAAKVSIKTLSGDIDIIEREVAT